MDKNKSSNTKWVIIIAAVVFVIGIAATVLISRNYYESKMKAKIAQIEQEAEEAEEQAAASNNDAASQPKEATENEKKAFAENFKKNITIKISNSSGDEEMGWDGSEWKVTNKNPYEVSGKDYTLSFKLYNWGEYECKRKTKGKDIPANGNVKFNEDLDGDGMALSDAKIIFTITDEEIYNKYHQQ